MTSKEIKEQYRIIASAKLSEEHLLKGLKDDLTRGKIEWIQIQKGPNVEIWRSKVGYLERNSKEYIRRGDKSRADQNVYSRRTYLQN